MTFLSPAVLGFLALGGLPLVIHLLSRRRPRVVPFAATEFVARTLKRVMRRVKLKQLILLLLRTAAVIAAVLALARPAPRSVAAPIERSDKPSATVIVLDAGYSMRYRHDGRTLFDRGRARARDILDSLGDEHTAAVVLAARTPRVLGEGLTGQFESLVRALQSSEPTWERADVAEALNAAEGLLAASDQPEKRIWLVSDFTAGSVEVTEVPAPPVAGGAPRAALGIVDVGKDAAEDGWLPDAHVASIEAAPAPDVAPRSFRVDFTVVNGGDEALEERSAVLARGDKAVSRVSVSARGGETVRRSFTHTFDAAGVQHLKVTLEEDALPADDVRWAVVDVRDERRILLVDGDPRMGSYRDEVFYLQRALAPGAGSVTGVRADTVTPDDAATRKLDDYAVVVLANVRAVDDAMAAALERYVEAGGALLATTGDRVDAEAWNRTLADLLPMTLWDVKQVARRDDPDAAARAVTFTALAAQHAVLDVFDGPEASVLKATLTYAYTLLKAGGGRAADEAQIVMQFSDGSPALVGRAVGAGRVMLLATSVDRDWSDLCIRTAFLPLVLETVDWLAGGRGAAGAAATGVGEARGVRVRAGATRIRVTAPDGEEQVVVVPPDLEAVHGVRTQQVGGGTTGGGFAAPGVYTVAQEIGGRFVPAPEEDFAVNLDPREADLKRIDPEELVARWGGVAPGAEGMAAPKAAPITGRRTLWSALLAALLVLLFAESVLTRRT